MNLYSRFLFFTLCFFYLSSLFSQELSRTQIKKIPVQNNYIIDSLNIVTSSVKIFDDENNNIDTSFYKVNGLSGTIEWIEKINTDSVNIEYTTFPFNLTQAFTRKSIQPQIIEEDIILNPYSYMPGNKVQEGVIDFGNIDYNGSFTRGLSFGNNQDVVLNSSLNLQMSGQVTDEIEITAALTDNNIPIQPEGNTQQIQEFDKVFIQVASKRHKLILGDYDVQTNNLYFMRFFKRLQGASYTGTIDLKDSTVNDNYTMNTSLNLAIARGRFTRNQLVIAEGNQGPYRLRGADNELLIIVMAGTERVFLNGQQLIRGADKDYVIDYNLGEITFTPNVMITRDSRVFVEFEYAVQNYFRTILHTANDIKINDKLHFNFNFYTEQDNKNQPINADFTDTQRLFLEEVGDNINEAIAPGFSIEEFDPSRVMYKLVDSLVNGFFFDSIFVVSTNSDSAIYRVLFSEVGFGFGNYIRAVSNANGTVFEWVAPDINGLPQGNFEPVTILITPKREQLLTGGMNYKDDKNIIMIDLGLSNDDQNTFSKNGDSNNVGVAMRTNYERRFFLNTSEKKDFYINVVGFYEYMQRNFSPLERYRPVEFNRDWNVPLTAQAIDEHWGGAGIGMVKSNQLNVNYQLQTFNKGNFYNGLMHIGTARVNHKNYFADAVIKYTTAEDSLRDSKYFWPKIELAKSFSQLKYWKIGGRFEQENNEIKFSNQSDSLTIGSFRFNEGRAYFGSPDTALNKAKIEYIWREESFAKQGNFSLATRSNTLNLTGEWASIQWQQLRYRFTYRNFENIDSMFTQNMSENFFLSRIEYNLNLLRGFISMNNLYEIGTGREQKRQFAFLEVPAGQGNFIWIDFNENSVQELNEFEIAPENFSDQAKFIRVAVPTNDFSPVNITLFSTSLNLNPRAIVKAKTGISGWIRRFSSLSSIQLDRRVFRGSGESIFNPFISNIEDTLLVASNSLVRQSLFFNRMSSIWGIEYSWQNNQNRSSLTNGFEIRSLKDNSMRIRWNLNQSFSLINKFSWGNKKNLSELFQERNFNIRFYEVQPDLSYLYGSKLRVSLIYKFSNGKNQIGELREKATTHDISTDMRYNIVTKSTISTKLTFALVEFTGNRTDAIQFALLQGLQDGNNFLWNISIDRNLANNIQLSLVYEGRKTGTADVVHTGRAQVRAIF